MYRALLIDPEHYVITVEETDGTIASIQPLIGARCVEMFRIAEHRYSYDYCWVDEFGMADNKPVHAFKYRGHGGPVAGKCLLVGAEKQTGEPTDAKFDIRILRANVEWLGLILPEVVWDVTEEEPFGATMRSIVTYARVKQ